MTDINKNELQKLAGGPLDKYGDLDGDSHKVRSYPSYIIDDMAKLREVINRILDENPGKKIAIVSDHGISYMSQLRPGLNLSGIKAIMEAATQPGIPAKPLVTRNTRYWTTR